MEHTQKIPSYEVKDISLADQGFKNIEWAEMEMGALMHIKSEFSQQRPLSGLKDINCWRS